MSLFNRLEYALRTIDFLFGSSGGFGDEDSEENVGIQAG
jgi:hypothetical protein